MHSARSIAASAVIVVLAATAAFAQSVEMLQVHAEAGLGGIVKAGRWMPVRVTVEHAGRALDAELLVEWGDARLRRSLVLASPGTRVFELYVRTTEPEGTVRVRVMGRGRELKAADVPVRVLRPAERVRLCVLSPAAVVDTTGCTAAVTPDALPASARGYEVVDRVAWPSGTARLSADQQEALDVWSALRGLDATGDLGLTPQPARPATRQGLPSGTTTLVSGVVAIYLAALVGIAAIAVRGRLRAWQMYAGLAAVVLGGTTVAAGVGRAGPGGAVRLHHSSLLQQVPGTNTSLLTVRGLVEFPALDIYRLELHAPDGTIEMPLPTGRAAGLADEDGQPTLAGRFGLGARRAFGAEGTVRMQPLVVQTTRSHVQVTNALDRPLSDCRFADGYSVPEVGELRPGESAKAVQLGETLGPIFTCTLRGALPVRITEAWRSVWESGETLIVVYPQPRASGVIARLPGADW